MLPSRHTPAVDLADLAATLFRLPRPQSPPPGATVAPVGLPTQQDIDEPVTPEMRAAMRVLVLQYAALVERHIVARTVLSPREALHDVQRMLTNFCLTYRRVAGGQS